MEVGVGVEVDGEVAVAEAGGSDVVDDAVGDGSGLPDPATTRLSTSSLPEEEDAYETDTTRQQNEALPAAAAGMEDEYPDSHPDVVSVAEDAPPDEVNVPPLPVVEYSQLKAGGPPDVIMASVAHDTAVYPTVDVQKPSPLGAFAASHVFVPMANPAPFAEYDTDEVWKTLNVPVPVVGDVELASKVQVAKLAARVGAGASSAAATTIEMQRWAWPFRAAVVNAKRVAAARSHASSLPIFH